MVGMDGAFQRAGSSVYKDADWAPARPDSPGEGFCSLLPLPRNVSHHPWVPDGDVAGRWSWESEAEGR